MLGEVELKVTQSASRELGELAAELRKYPPEGRISAEHAKALVKFMSNVETTLRAESATLNTYVLTEKRMDVKRLVDKPESFLTQGTFGKLPPVAQYDIKQAGKCIAFEVPTAAAFHLLRATEDTLRAYCSKFIRRGRKDKPTWGDMIIALREKTRSPKPEKTLLDHLDNLRGNFRNPTDHPEMVYGIDEVQDLFGIVIDVLNRMARELP